MTLYEFADRHNLEVVFRRYPKQQGRFTCYIEDAEVKKGKRILESIHGNGKSPQSAMADYVTQIKGRLLVMYANHQSRKELRVPRNLALALGKNPELPVAHISGTLGRGIVYTKSDTFIVEADKMYNPEVAGSTHLGMWMQGPNDIEEIEAGEFPFLMVYNYLKEQTKKKERELFKQAKRKAG